MEFLNLKEAAKILKMKPDTLRDLFLSGQFRSGKKIGGCWKIYKDDLLSDYRNFEGKTTTGRIQWQSSSVQAPRIGTLDLPRQMAKEYADRLGLKTSKQRNS